MQEELLALYCSLVLGKLKPSNLFSIPHLNYDVKGLIKEWNDIFNKYDIYFVNICTRKNSSLVLCFREDLLNDSINLEDTKCFLNTCGYDTNDINSCMGCLKTRFISSDFPHEIGLFLGYPYEDVIGFIENKGRNYLYSGYWKVYKNKDEKCKLFRLYNKTRLEYLAAKEKHIDLLKLVRESR